MREATVVGGAEPVGRQRIAWAAVWGGVLFALTVYLVLELALFATGAREISIDAAVNEGAFLTALAAFVAFFLGSMLAGMTMPWTEAPEGLVQGLAVWSLGIVAFITLAVAGSGLALGGVGTATDEIGQDIETLVDDVQAGEVTDDAREAAGWALLGLGLTLVASLAGGAVGSKIGADRRTRPVVGPASSAITTSTLSDDYDERSVEELRMIAADRHIEGRSTMSKDELVHALRRD